MVPLPSLALCADEPAPLTAQPEPTGLANLHAVGAALNASALRDFMEVKGQWREEAEEEAEPIDFNCEAEALKKNKSLSISIYDKKRYNIRYMI